MKGTVGVWGGNWEGFWDDLGVGGFMDLMDFMDTVIVVEDIMVQ